MGKDPAFLFYSKDWIGDTAEYTDSEVRVLIDLMCYNHINGDLPNDTKRLAQMVRKSEEEFIKIWDVIKIKFEPNGYRTVNRKLKQVVNQRIEKSLTNTISGIFASLLRLSDLKKKEKELLKSEFKIEDFKKYPKDQLKERITEWFTDRLAFGDRNGDQSIGNVHVNENINEKENIKHKYGEYDNVLLTDKEFEKLKEKYPNDYYGIIQELSERKEMKGYSYKSDYLAILKWVVESYFKSNKKEDEPPDFTELKKKYAEKQ